MGDRREPVVDGKGDVLLANMTAMPEDSEEC